MENRQNVFNGSDMLDNDDRTLENVEVKEVKTPSPLSSAGRNFISSNFTCTVTIKASFSSFI